MFKYLVLNFETNQEKEIEIFEDDLLKRYGSLGSPTPMMVKDKACKTGLFPWDQYSDLRVRRLKD